MTLLWTESTNTVAVAVLDTNSGEELEFEIDGRFALDAFIHPYAYAATVRARSAEATPLAPTRVSSPPTGQRHTTTHTSGPRF